MGPVDIEYEKWHKKMYGKGEKEPSYKEQKHLFAAHLLATKSRSWIWNHLCGPITGPCHCNCLCPTGIAWNAILERDAKQKEV